MRTPMTTTTRPFTRLYPVGVAEDLQPSAPTMLEAWRRTAGIRADRAAVHYFDQTLTFGEVDAASDALAVAFQRHGVQPGDRVAVYLQNDPQWLVCLLAAWKCGAAVACVNPMLRQHELLHHVGDAAPKVLVCLDQLYTEVVAPIRHDLPADVVITTA